MTMKVKLNTGIPEEDQKKVIERLQPILADVYVAFVQARNFHWNVVGKNFNDLHAKFQALYEMFDDMGDEIAERVRALDATPLSTMAEWLAAAKLKEVVSKDLAAEEMVVILVSDLESIAVSMRAMCEDEEFELDDATETMLGAFLQDIEKQVWMLRSFLA